jgi:hypothetical protein
MGKSMVLSAEAMEQLQRSINGKITSDDGQISNLIEVLAIQLELDDEQLAEWREKKARTQKIING